jgi:hypothetical protein
MAEFKESVANRLGQRFSMILPVSQLRKASDDHREVVRIAAFQLVKEFPHGTLPCFGLIKLYCEMHAVQH